MAWRELRFAFLLPEDRDEDILVDEMVDALAGLLGCSSHDVEKPCQAEWAVSCVTLDLEEGDE